MVDEGIRSKLPLPSSLSHSAWGLGALRSLVFSPLACEALLEKSGLSYPENEVAEEDS